MRFLFISLFITISISLNAQTIFTSVEAGDWEDCDTWDTCPGSVAGVDYPGRTDDIVLNHKVTVSATNDNGSPAVRPRELGLSNVCGGNTTGNTPGGCSSNSFYQDGKITINSGGELESDEKMIFTDTVQVNSGGILDLEDDVFIIGFINAETGSDISFGDDLVISGDGVINSAEAYSVADDLYIDGEDAAICGSGVVTLANAGGGPAAEIQTFYITDDEVLDQFCSEVTIVCADGDCCEGNCTSDLEAVGNDGTISPAEGTGDRDQILPVILLSFEAKEVNNGIQIQWITGSEIDNDHFILSKSTDGLIFNIVAEIDGVGNTSDITTYTFVDKSANAFSYFYKLEQIDFDGTKTTFEIIQVASNSISSFQAKLLQNPTSEVIRIQMKYNTHVPIEIRLLSLSGQVLYEKKEQPTPLINIDINSLLSPGVYLLSVNQGRNSIQQRLIID